MCHLGVNTLIKVYHLSLLCEIDESRFRIPKTSVEKRRLLSILFRNLRFTRTNGRYRFFENQGTFGYCIQISKDLDTISKSLKIFIQVFIGYPNTCTWCGIQAVICSWIYELLMSLRTLNIVLSLVRLWKKETNSFCVWTAIERDDENETS